MEDRFEHLLLARIPGIIHEPVQRYRNESVIAPNMLSFGKAEQYEIPPDMEQLMGLPKSSMLVRNVRSKSC